MQTNCLLQQFVLAGQNPVSSYRLMPPLRFALLFFFFFIFPSNSSTAETNRDHPWKRRAPTTSLSINICLQTKRCQESFFFSLSEDLKPSSKVLGCFYHSAIQRVLDIFFFLCPTTFRDLGQIGLQLQQRPQEEERQISQD